MKSILFNFIILTLLASATQSQPLQTVAQVNLQRYAGKWYEIASYPNIFQKGCHCTTATYTLSDKGYVIVENRCNRDSVKGKLSYIKGKAFVVKNSGNAKLKVQFFWPFRGDYWIIDLGEDYNYAVVSDPSKKYLWILSRTPKMAGEKYSEIIVRLNQMGFNIAKLHVTEQI